MSVIWGSSFISPVNRVTFHWKIENFDRALKTFGVRGVTSPGFKVVDYDGKENVVKLKFDKFTGSGYEMHNVKENGLDVDLEKYSLIEVKLISKGELCLAARLDIDSEGNTVSCDVGDPEKIEFVSGSSSYSSEDRYWDLKSLVSNITYSTSNGKGTTVDGHVFGGFIVSNTRETLQMKVQISTPGVVTNSTSPVQNDLNENQITKALCLQELPEEEESVVVDILLMAHKHKLEDIKKVASQRILMDKTRFAKSDYFVKKMKETPDVLLELFQS